jgi:tight adherence protein C
MKMIALLWSAALTGWVFFSLMFGLESSGWAHSFRRAGGEIRDILTDFGRKYLVRIKAPDKLSRVVNQKFYTRTGLGFERQLFLAGWWVGLQFFSLGLIGLWILMGCRFLPLFILLLVGLLFGLAPAVYINYLVRKRQRLLKKAFPDFLDLINMTVKAGIGFLPALRRVAESLEGPLADDLMVVDRYIKTGFTVSQALTRWAEMTSLEDIERFAESITLSQKLGTSLSRTLKIQADLLRAKRRRQAEEQVQTAPIRIIPALVFCFLPSLMLIYLAPPILNFLLMR